jgi:hypothetical protein
MTEQTEVEKDAEVVVRKAFAEARRALVLLGVLREPSREPARQA